MAFWIRRGPVGAAETKDEIREQPSRPGPKWSPISASQMAIQRAKAQYAPGGGFGKGTEAGLERGRVKAMASGMQGLVGAGLAGTTMAGGLGLRYEEEVAAPTRAGVEGLRAQAISGIEMQQASMGFGASQAGAQRELQKYIADLQATLQRESMAPRGPTMTAPTGSPQARQFPSLYDQGSENLARVGGIGVSTDRTTRTANTPWPTPAQGFWGASEKWRSEQPEWVTGAGG